MTEPPRLAAATIDAMPDAERDVYRRLVVDAERGQALDRKTSARIGELLHRARTIDAELARRSGHRQFDPGRENAQRMEAAGLRAEALTLAIKAL